MAYNRTQSAKQLEDLRSQLESLERKKRLLEKTLNFEKISVLMSPSTLSTPDKALKSKEHMYINEARLKISSCVDAVTERSLLQVLNSAYRFAGLTTFVYETNCRCLRVDTFYNRCSYESYLVLLSILPRSVNIINHNLPDFIDLESMNDQILSYDAFLFGRFISELMVAYVSRREQINELENYDDRNCVEIATDKVSYTEVYISISHPHQLRYSVVLKYGNWVSMYPTNVDIEKSDSVLLYWDDPSYWNNIVNAYKCNTLLEAYIASNN